MNFENQGQNFQTKWPLGVGVSQAHLVNINSVISRRHLTTFMSFFGSHMSYPWKRHVDPARLKPSTSRSGHP